MTITLPKTHLSHSQINMYLRCPMQYYYRYLEDLVIPPSGNMFLGTTGHKALAYNFSQKIESQKDLKKKDVVEYFANEFETGIKEQEIDWQNETPKNLKDGGVKVIDKFQEDQAPAIQPVLVEAEFNLEFENVDYTIKGFIDLIDDTKKVRDHKISGKKPSSVSPDQLIVYRMGYKKIFNEEPGELSFNYMVTTKNPQIIDIPVDVTDQDEAEYLELVGNVVYAITNNVFYRNTTNWTCNPKYCGYFSKCRPHRFIREVF